MVTESGSVGCAGVCIGADVELRREERVDVRILHVDGGPDQGGCRALAAKVAASMWPGGSGARRESRLCGWSRLKEAAKDGRPTSAVAVARACAPFLQR